MLELQQVNDYTVVFCFFMRLGVEYAGIAASERLFSAKSHVKQFQVQTEELEATLRKLEVKNIEATSKQTEKNKKKQEEKATKNTLVEDSQQLQTIYEKTDDFDIHEMKNNDETIKETEWDTQTN